MSTTRISEARMLKREDGMWEVTEVREDGKEYTFVTDDKKKAQMCYNTIVYAASLEGEEDD